MLFIHSLSFVNIEVIERELARLRAAIRPREFFDLVEFDFGVGAGRHGGEFEIWRGNRRGHGICRF